MNLFVILALEIVGTTDNFESGKRVVAWILDRLPVRFVMVHSQLIR
jgi:hypothetical protein